MKFLIVIIPEKVFLNTAPDSIYINLVSILTFYLNDGLGRCLSNLVAYYIDDDLSKKVAVYCFNNFHFKGSVSLNFIIDNLESVLGHTLIDFGLTEDISKWLFDRKVKAIPIEYVGEA